MHAKLVRKIEVKGDIDFSQVADKLLSIESEVIACVNWKGKYPSAPKVSFKMAHNGDYLFLQYFVEENEILARTKEDNGPVWTDSCVEFFISFGGSSLYYNLESSCIGKVLLGYRENKANAEHGSLQVLSSIKRLSTLGDRCFDKKQGDFKWSLILAIPATAFWHSGLKKLDGVKARANAYKCGDDLSVPHFLSWAPIDADKPNFHLPQYFRDVIFE